ncbi:MAG: polysaccharide biosynthesis protein [Phycisphaeraceae bacterium]|nr:polysaccharide biosynthesis protein [Phycisphaeraceae bacterium]
MTGIPLSQPDITEKDIEAVVATLRSGRLSIGPRQSRFEEMVAERAKRRRGVAINSGTSGLHLVLRALDIGPGDEVITTPFSFVASANCILMVGAKPVFVDIDPRSMNMDPAKVEAAITNKTKAIIGVEVFGDPTHMDRLAQIAGAHEIPLIEDACEGLGGVYKDRPVGSFGRAAVFGFYPNKQITTGEGGMIVTDDDKLADMCISLRNQGRDDMSLHDPGCNTQAGSWLAHSRLGYNYRLSEINCALGISQMERLDEILETRRNVAQMYFKRLMGFKDLILPNLHENESRSWFVFVVRLSDLYGQTERDRIVQGLRRHDVGAANYFPCIHLQPFYKQRFGYDKGMLPIAEAMSQRTVALPFFNRMDETHVELATHTLHVMLQREQLLMQKEVS